MAMPIRVGAVSYLNAKPLYYGLCDSAPAGSAVDGRSEPAGRAARRAASWTSR